MFLYLEKKNKKMEHKKTGSLARAKNIFEELKTDDESVLFTEEKIMIEFLKG